jgi:hypothetical protein
MSDSEHHPLESPWFWLLVFSTMALVAVLLIGPKFMRRQARLEQKLEGRVRAQQEFDLEAPAPLGERGGGENDLVTVGPLAGFLGVLAAVAWFQWTRERSRWVAERRAALAKSISESPEHNP